MPYALVSGNFTIIISLGQSLDSYISLYCVFGRVLYRITVFLCHPYCERESTKSLILHYACSILALYGSYM